MGNPEKLMNQIFDLKFTSKSLQRQARKCEKEEKEQKLKVKKAIEKGNVDGARIYAENAIVLLVRGWGGAPRRAASDPRCSFRRIDTAREREGEEEHHLVLLVRGRGGTPRRAASDPRCSFRRIDTALLPDREPACRVITEAAKQSGEGWGSTGDWTEIEGAWVLRPKSSEPSFVVHFVGGIFVGAAPQITYRFFLERLADSSADNSVRMWDRRNLGSGGAGSPIHKFEGHKSAVLCVQWSPDKASVFGSSAEDGFLNVWDHEKVGKKKIPNSPAGLFFQHAGHRDKIVDFHWNSSDPWTIVSVSDDGESTGGGGTLQIWRMSDLIYRPEEEVLTELENFKSHLASCTPRT